MSAPGPNLAFLLVGGVAIGNGFLMLIAPTQFATPAYSVIAGLLPLYGVLLLAGGGALLAGAGATSRWRGRSAVAGIVLLPLWASFIHAGLVTGVVTLGIQLGAVAASVSSLQVRIGRRRLFTAMLGLIQLGQALAMVTVPQQFAAPALYGSYGQFLGALAPAFGAAGIGLLFFRPSAPWGKVAAVLGALTFASLAYTFVGTRIWTGVLNYGLMATMLLLPLSRRSSYRQAEVLLFGAAGLISAIDAVMWVFGATSLLPLRLDVTAMRPGTALGVLILATAGMSIALRRRWRPELIAGVGIALGIGLLIQSTIVGIDRQPAADTEIATRTTSAIMLVLAGVATLAAANAPRDSRLVVMSAGAMVVGALALLNLLAYLVNQPILFAAFGVVSMRLHTGIAFALLSAGILMQILPPVMLPSVGRRFATGFAAVLTLVSLEFFVAVSATNQLGGENAVAAGGAMIGLLIVVYVLMAVLGYLVVRSITGPLSILASAMKRFGAGDANARATIVRSDELGQAARTFNGMAAELTRAKQGLEEQVAAERRTNALLEESRAEMEHFVVIVSHEFRTPLTAIQGFSEMLRDEEVTPANVKDFATSINDESHRLGKLVSDMLDLGRLQSGRADLVRSMVAIGDVIDRVVGTLGPGATKHRIVTEYRDAPAIDADADKVQQIITNLLGNAIKYSPAGGTITVSARGDGNDLLLSVRDEGMGIPVDQLERIFEPYRRVDRSVQGITGTGLGLPIARDLVLLHGGRIWVESAPGKGSTFYVRLPIAAPVAI